MSFLCHSSSLLTLTQYAAIRLQFCQKWGFSTSNFSLFAVNGYYCEAYQPMHVSSAAASRTYAHALTWLLSP